MKKNLAKNLTVLSLHSQLKKGVYCQLADGLGHYDLHWKWSAVQKLKYILGV
jgi:hypothetical protein